MRYSWNLFVENAYRQCYNMTMFKHTSWLERMNTGVLGFSEMEEIYGYSS